MITSTDNELRVGKSLCHHVEGFNHEFETFISSPLSECQNAMLGIAAARKIRVLGTLSQSAVGAYMYVVTTVFFIEDLAITGHKNRDRIRQ